MKHDISEGVRPVVTDINISEAEHEGLSHLRIPAKYKWTALFLVITLSLGHTWTGSALGALKNTLREELGINDTYFGVISSADALLTPYSLLLEA
ncbi:hypothetical protein BFJ70_g7993 [Fusarium oxysporum]|nr:hypothetical protein BFJ70_g7993 [Fusarium oxysporum]